MKITYTIPAGTKYSFLFVPYFETEKKRELRHLLQQYRGKVYLFKADFKDKDNKFIRNSLLN